MQWIDAATLRSPSDEPFVERVDAWLRADDAGASRRWGWRAAAARGPDDDSDDSDDGAGCCIKPLHTEDRYAILKVLLHHCIGSPDDVKAFMAELASFFYSADVMWCFRLLGSSFGYDLLAEPRAFSFGEDQIGNSLRAVREVVEIFMLDPEAELDAYQLQLLGIGFFLMESEILAWSEDLGRVVDGALVRGIRVRYEAMFLQTVWGTGLSENLSARLIVYVAAQYALSSPEFQGDALVPAEFLQRWKGAATFRDLLLAACQYGAQTVAICTSEAMNLLAPMCALAALPEVAQCCADLDVAPTLEACREIGRHFEAAVASPGATGHRDAAFNAALSDQIRVDMDWAHEYALRDKAVLVDAIE